MKISSIMCHCECGASEIFSVKMQTGQFYDSDREKKCLKCARINCAETKPIPDGTAVYVFEKQKEV